MSATLITPTKLGNLGEALAEAYAFATGPGSIERQIAQLQQARAMGERGEDVALAIANWRAIRDVQRRLLEELDAA